MDHQTPTRPRRRWLRSWQLPTLLSLLLIVAFVYWLIPDRIDRFETADGRRSWDADGVPFRRQLVWQPAEALTALRDAVKNRPEFKNADWIRPQLADGGGTLYFTLRPKNGNADVYVSHLRNGSWQIPQPVAAWNTTSDDIGPAISRDGREAYFYSNRPGGSGGFDLYVSRFKKNAWSHPQNLGPRINTPAHEYDPAITPDGTRLFFASNRTEGMQNNAGTKTGANWPATLRANPGKTRFDLYAASRDESSKPWNAASPLQNLNREDSNEGAPAVSPDGLTLYFVSDRKGGHGGFDLYRAELRDGEPVGIRNLGSEINTDANEHEPAVSPEGFTLIFSSDREDAGKRYALYQSRAVEVTRTQGWDDANWRAFVAVWRDNWPWALATCGVLLVVFLIWRAFAKKISERTLAARFLLCSMIVHLLLLLVAGVATIGRAILDERNNLREDAVAATFHDNSLRQSHQRGVQAFEKLADLKAVEQAAIPPQRREVQDVPNIPHAERRMPPTIDAREIAKLPRERVILVPPKANPQPKRNNALQRRPRLPVMKLAKVDPEKFKLPKAVLPKRKPLKQPAPAIPRKAMQLKPPAKGDDAPREVASRKPVSLLKRPYAGTPQPSAPKTKLIAKRTIPFVSPVKPTKSKGESNKLAKTENAPDKPTTPGSSNLPLPKKSTPISSAKPKDQVAVIPRKPGPLNAKPAKQPTPAVGAKQAGIPLKRKPLVLKPANVKEQDDPAKLAKNDPRLQPLNLPKRKTPGSKALPKPVLPKFPSRKTAGTIRLPQRPISVGKLSKRKIDTPPVVGKRSSDLPRRLAKAAPVPFAGEGVGMKKMLTIRRPELRNKLLPLLGATKESEEAVDRALHWLARHQFADGHWSLNNFGKACKGHKPCTGRGHLKSDTAGTGLALLPFLGRGQTHKKGEYRKVIERGLKWLIEHQKKTGDLFTGGSHNAYMYSHGIATIALCEAYAMTRDDELKRPAQRAIDFIVKAQHKSTGGWRYKPGERGDTSVVGWQVMALKSGEMAGLRVPASTLKKAGKWLDRVESTGRLKGQYGYSSRGATITMTAEALLCRQFLGTPRNDPGLQSGAKYLLNNLPRRGKFSSYYWYYATQVMYHLRGEHWKKWHDPMRNLLKSSQTRTGRMSGTWNPADNWERQAGRLYATSLRTLMLEVYYRHLPLYDHLAK